MLLNDLIKATGWSILHSLWQGALIYALLLPSQLNVFRVKAKLRYALAYGANCLMFICFIFTFFSVFQWQADQHVIAAAQHQTAAITMYAASIPVTLSQYAEMAFPFLVMFYAFGLLIQSYIVLKGYQKVQRLIRASHSAVPEEWHTLFLNLTSKLNIKKHIDFYVSAHVQVPLVVGYLKPVILFPVALTLQMDMKQVEAILIHELSHVRRNDYMLNLVRTLIDTLLFFNPFVWLVGKFINIEREHACDDLVVSLTKTPLTYAHALLKLELLADKTNPAMAMAATGENQHLYQRIKRITDMKTNYMNSKQKLSAITLTIATIISLAWINPAKSEKQTKKTAIQEPERKISINVTAPSDTTKKKIRVIKKIQNGKVVYLVKKDTLGKEPRIEIIETAPGQELNIVLDSAFNTNELAGTITDFTENVKNLTIAGLTNGPGLAKMQLDIQKQGLELQKKFNSPEERAKWQKLSKDVQVKLNSPEERAKWQKLSKDIQLKYNTPEERAKWMKIAQGAQLKLNNKNWDQSNLSTEQLEKIKKLTDLSKVQLNKMFDSDGVKIMIDGQKLSKLNSEQFKMLGSLNSIRINENPDRQKVKQTPEYIELKKKFDKDVEELINKKLKKSDN